MPTTHGAYDIPDFSCALVFEFAELGVPPAEADPPKAKEVRTEAKRADAPVSLQEVQRYMSRRGQYLYERTQPEAPAAVWTATSKDNVIPIAIKLEALDQENLLRKSQQAVQGLTQHLNPNRS
jgi:hypothetical protein